MDHLSWYKNIIKPNIIQRGVLIFGRVLWVRRCKRTQNRCSSAQARESSYAPQVKQHCFWTDLREQRPSSFNLSQKRGDMVFLLQTGPARGGGWRLRKQNSLNLRRGRSSAHLSCPCSPARCTSSVSPVWTSSRRGCLASQQNPPR